MDNVENKNQVEDKTKGFLAEAEEFLKAYNENKENIEKAVVILSSTLAEITEKYGPIVGTLLGKYVATIGSEFFKEFKKSQFSDEVAKLEATHICTLYHELKETHKFSEKDALELTKACLSR